MVNNYYNINLEADGVDRWMLKVPSMLNRNTPNIGMHWSSQLWACILQVGILNETITTSTIDRKFIETIESSLKQK